LFLVPRGTPATVDEELDPVGRGIGRGSAQGSEQIGIEVGHGRNLVVEDGHGVRHSAMRLAEGTPNGRSGAGRCWCRFAVGHAANQGNRAVASAYEVFDMPTTCTGP